MDESQLIDVLRRGELLASCDHSTLVELVRSCPKIELQDGEILFDYGDEGRSMYAVVSGRLCVFRHKRILNQFGPGEYLGEMALIEPDVRSASVRAIGPTVALEIGEEAFRRFLLPSPGAMLTLVQIGIRRLRRLTDRTQAAYEEVNMAVHDMLNMLGVFEYARLLAERFPEGSDDRFFLEAMGESSDSLESVMRRVLNRARGLEEPYEKMDVEMDRLVRGLLDNELAMHDDVRGRQVALEVATGMHPVRCNPVDLRRVVSNLVINAAQASPDGSTITVRIGQPNGTTRIEVIDQGSGIPEEAQPHVFESQFTTKQQGNGLGLASCREIVQHLHGGRLTFETEIGRGTTFVCELPTGNE